MNASEKPIDRHRDSAISMDIGQSDEGGITGTVKFFDRLLIVKEGAIYEMLLADKIDPERKNISIPNAQKRILTRGSKCKIVSKTLLIADYLFKPKFMPDGFDYDTAMENTLNITKLLIEMEESCRILEKEETDIINNLNIIPVRSGYIIPSIIDLEPRCKSYLQRADHAIVALFNIVRIFYGNKITHADSFLEKINNQNNRNVQFIGFLTGATPFFRLIRHARNAVEHPKPTERIVIDDFSINPGGKLRNPSITIFHPASPIDQISIIDFMDEITKTISEAFEMVLVHMCAEHAKFGAFPIAIVDNRDIETGRNNLAFSYAAEIDGKWIPMG